MHGLRSLHDQAVIPHLDTSMSYARPECNGSATRSGAQMRGRSSFFCIIHHTKSAFRHWTASGSSTAADWPILCESGAAPLTSSLTSQRIWALGQASVRSPEKSHVQFGLDMTSPKLVRSTEHPRCGVILLHQDSILVHYRDMQSKID